MPSKSQSTPKGRSGLSYTLARALPFEHAWLRYACCLWIIATLSATSWALFVTQPDTERLLQRSQHLLELETNLQQARAGSQHTDLPALRKEANEARSQLYSDPQNLDLRILEIVDALTLLGWKAIVGSVDRDNASNEHLAYATYHLELQKEARPETDQSRQARSDARPIDSDIFAFLQTISTSKKQIAIDKLDIQTSDGQSAKVFAQLSAAIVK